MQQGRLNFSALDLNAYLSSFTLRQFNLCIPLGIVMVTDAFF
jgi:hypothetical protein